MTNTQTEHAFASACVFTEEEKEVHEKTEAQAMLSRRRKNEIWREEAGGIEREGGGGSHDRWRYQQWSQNEVRKFEPETALTKSVMRLFIISARRFLSTADESFTSSSSLLTLSSRVWKPQESKLALNTKKATGSQKYVNIHVLTRCIVHVQ